jgi:hypothetical protein
MELFNYLLAQQCKKSAAGLTHRRPMLLPQSFYGNRVPENLTLGLYAFNTLVS